MSNRQDYEATEIGEIPDALASSQALLWRDMYVERSRCFLFCCASINRFDRTRFLVERSSHCLRIASVRMNRMNAKTKVMR